MIDAKLLSNRAFDCELASEGGADVLWADASEIETINLMTEGIAGIPEITYPGLREWIAKSSSITRLQNFASFVAREETITAQYKMQQGTQDSVEQKVLCISKNTTAEEGRVSGAWTNFFREALQLRNQSQLQVN